jgi:hypothetical protein
VDESELPLKLELDGSYERLVELLYSVFERNFLASRCFFNGFPVVVDNRRIDSDKEEGFWHVVTRTEIEGRVLDYKRAKRLPWLKPLIESPADVDILRWEESEPDRRRGTIVRKHFIWYEHGDYLIVLKENPGRYYLATAFHVTGPHEHDRYMRKYQAQKKGTGY